MDPVAEGSFKLAAWGHSPSTSLTFVLWGKQWTMHWGCGMDKPRLSGTSLLLSLMLLCQNLFPGLFYNLTLSIAWGWFGGHSLKVLGFLSLTGLWSKGSVRKSYNEYPPLYTTTVVMIVFWGFPCAGLPQQPHEGALSVFCSEISKVGSGSGNFSKYTASKRQVRAHLKPLCISSRSPFFYLWWNHIGKGNRQ